MAARNNADWYAMMADIHGCRYDHGVAAFLMRDQPPPYHSWMTTLDPDAAAAQLALIDAHKDIDGFGLKDGFDNLDLVPLGFKSGFTASWIYADAPLQANTARWVRIETPENLLKWEAAWKGTSPSDQRQFPDAILQRDDVVMWGRIADNGVDAGGIINRSTDCIGISNVFGSDSFAAFATLAHRDSDGLPCVGYERGDDLKAALAAGFTATGQLRVWFS